MTVQRYSINECASTGVEHDSSGDYVLFEDYQDKSDDYTDLKIRYDSLVKALGELYQEY